MNEVPNMLTKLFYINLDKTVTMMRQDLQYYYY